MSRFILATRSLCDAHHAAINLDAGCPIRGVTYGGPDRVSPLPGPGWTISVVYDLIEVSESIAVLEVPEDRLHHLGNRGVPVLAQTKIESELPAQLLARVRARRGQDADGNPIPPAGAR